MKPVKIIAENPQAQTFAATLECEHCGFTEDVTDLPNTPQFRQGELPSMPCPKCERSSNQPVLTRDQYAEGQGANEAALAELQEMTGAGQKEAPAEGEAQATPTFNSTPPASPDDNITDDEVPDDPWAGM